MNVKGNELFEVIVWAQQTWQDVDIADIARNFPLYYQQWYKKILHDSPQHVLIETGLILFIIWLVFIRRTVDPSKKSKSKLTEKEVDELVDSWEPEPLIAPLSEKSQNIADSMLIIEKVEGNYVKIAGYSKPVLNLGSFDFLGFARSQESKEVARATLQKYGCGSCGPRGFYGTIDQHLKIEDVVAKFMNTEEAIAYSDGATAVSSSIPAFAKKGDILLVDEACCEAILTGVNLSRSTVQFFKHNDMEDLQAILAAIANDDRRLNRDSTQQRRFIVAEGLYRNTGELCPLPELIRLKNKFCYRLVLDESLSFGTIGKSGRGVTEHFEVSPSEIEILTVAMDTALGSVGGLCIGTREVVDHQRLSGAGYCFSAAAPPFVSAVAAHSVSQLEAHPELAGQIQAKSEYFREQLSCIVGLKVVGATSMSPVIHLQMQQPPNSLAEEEAVIDTIYNGCLMRGVGLVTSKYPLVNPGALRPSLRLTVSITLTEAEIKGAVTTINAVVRSILNY